MLSRYISVNIRNGIINLLKKSGENTLYVIIVHELLIACICVQILLGIMIGIIIEMLKNKLFLEKRV